MASQLKQIALAPGGLNLSAPVDRLAVDDCLQLEGFWPASMGRLEQAKGFAVRNPLELSLTSYDSLLQVGGKYYYGGAGMLRMIGRSTIDTGYDGQPLGLIANQNYAWICNQGKQRKDDGALTSNWTTETPPLPTGTAATPTPYSSGTVAVTQGDPNIVGSGFSSAISGMIFNVAGDFDFYTFTYETATTGYLDRPYSAVSNGAASFTIAGGNLSAGGYSYYVTFENMDGHEGNPSPKLFVSMSSDGSTFTINLPTATELVSPSGALAVFGWNVYRQSPNTALAWQVNQNVLPYATTATYTDTGADPLQSDDAVLSFGKGLEVNHNPPPAALVLANQTYNGRVVAANTLANPNRIFFTNALEPSFFPGSDGSAGGNWVDCGTDQSDAVLAMTVRNGLLMIYRRRSIWQLLGDFTDPNAVLQPVVPEFGIVGPRAVYSTAIGDWVVSDEGVHMIHDWPQKISAKIEPLFLGKTSPFYSAINPAYLSTSALGYHNGRLWFSYAAGGGVANNETMVYHVDTQRWYSRGVGIGAFMAAGEGNDFVGAIFSAIVNLESGWVDNGSNTILGYASGYADCDAPDHEKSWADLVINHNTDGQDIAVWAWVNKGTDHFQIATLNSSDMTRQVIPLVYPAGHMLGGDLLPIRSFNLSIQLTGYGALGAPGVSIDGPILLHYYERARQARTFDSGETDHGTPGNKQIDVIEIDIDSSLGPASLQIYSDLPGNVLAARLAPVTIAQTNGRQVVRFTLSSPVDGRLFRYLVNSRTNMQVYAMRVRVLPIGVYLDGTVSDVWQCQALGIGV